MFADILVKILQDRHMKPYHLAKATGISAGLMSDYVNDKKQPTLSNIIKIADFLNVSVDELLGRDNDSSKQVISENESSLISRYSELSTDDQKTVNRVVEAFYESRKKN